MNYMNSKRKKIVAGNWKMNLNSEEVDKFVFNLTTTFSASRAEMILFPASIYIANLCQKLATTNIRIGAQNCSEFEKGAFTGEISASMLKSIGASHCLIGHSERRIFFQENHHQLQSKIKRCLENNIIPVYCIGETLTQRESGAQLEVIRNQLFEVVMELNEIEISQLIIAYEPVWAIGTGLTATPEQAQEMHSYIRQIITDEKSHPIAENLSILYGGSCNSNNAKQLFSCPDIDGGLIGGASLNANDFFSIYNSF
jgi:triosephosphate isomerase (TIM)